MTVANDIALVTLSEAAASKLRGIMEENGLGEAHALRVFVSGGGCSGLQYGMAFDDNPSEADVVFEQWGLRVLIDPRSAPYIEGANIDFRETPMGSGFQIDNPNAVSGCGCGGGSCGTGDEAGGCSSCQ